MSKSDPRQDEGTARNADSRQRVPLAGGVLVYEERAIGRELVGFEDVADWGDLADGLAARGHDRGTIHYLPELDREVA